MRGTVALFCFVGFLVARARGNTMHTQSKIIGGQPIDIKYRPFMLSLHASGRFVCGASILSRTWGITALHCLISSNKYYVRAGSNRTSRGGSLHRITIIYVYNSTFVSWTEKIPLHDIALFKVKPPFHFSRNVRPIRLPQSTDEIQNELLVCGWGYSDLQKPSIASTIMGVYVRHVPFESCVKATSTYAALVKDDYHLCYGNSGKDACFGDSGGALADTTTIYGIVSFGYHCGIVPGVYVKVSYYREWIDDVMKLY